MQRSTKSTTPFPHPPRPHPTHPLWYAPEVPDTRAGPVRNSRSETKLISPPESKSTSTMEVVVDSSRLCSSRRCVVKPCFPRAYLSRTMSWSLSSYYFPPAWLPFLTNSSIRLISAPPMAGINTFALLRRRSSTLRASSQTTPKETSLIPEASRRL